MLALRCKIVSSIIGIRKVRVTPNERHSITHWTLCLQISERVKVTDSPITVKTKQFIGSRQDVLSLAQGKSSP